jgi:hypothetical protein
VQSNRLSVEKIHIVTIHGKERVIGPMLENKLEVQTSVIRNLNTDKFGTFSGEIERKDPPLITLRKKIEAAYELTGHSIIVGSEGSFGSHPALFMLPADEEWVMLKDFERDLEIVGRHLTEETNFSGDAVSSIRELEEFCERVKFPSHGLILKLEDKIHKDLERDSLFELVTHAQARKIKVNIETDMRADRNPTRMKAIGKATDNLIERLKSNCPQCNSPGFWITDVVPGLPCKLCGLPTKSIQSFIYTCKNCNHKEIRANPEKTSEEPMYCNYCNP